MGRDGSRGPRSIEEGRGEGRRGENVRMNILRWKEAT